MCEGVCVCAAQVTDRAHPQVNANSNTEHNAFMMHIKETLSWLYGALGVRRLCDLGQEETCTFYGCT